MEKLNEKDIDLLLELIISEKNSIRNNAFHDEVLRIREIDLDFLIIKLNTIKKINSR